MPRRISMSMVLGGLLLAFGVARLVAEIPLLWEYEARDNAEAIVYGQAMRWLHDEPLYQPLNSAPYTVTAYMPLYYTLAAVGHVALGPSFLAGRLITLVASICLAATVGLLARQLTRNWWAAAIGSGLVLTLSFAGPPGPPWLAVYRVDAFGVALAVGAVTVLAGGASSGQLTYRRVLAAGLLACLALLTKQTLAAATLAGGLWLLEQDWRKAVLFGAVVGLPVVLVSALFEWWTGAFFQNVVTANLNPFDVTSLVQNLFILSIFQLGTLLATLTWVATHGRGGRGSVGRLLVYYWAVALLPMFGLAKVGSWHNYWIEWSVPMAVLTAATLVSVRPVTSFLQRVVYVVPRVAMVVSMLLAAFVSIWSVRTALADWSSQAQRAAELSQVVRCVAASPGASIGMPMDAVVLAGEPLYVEPAIFTILVDAGVVQDGPVLDAIRHGGVGVVVMDLRPEAPQWQHGAGQPIWRPDVLAALRESMELRSEKAGRMIYTPKDRPPPPECS
ncbi:MAG: hypothetical protein U0893_27490 [Chloroflexota bacterium]